MRRQGRAVELIDVRTPVEYPEVHAEPARLDPAGQARPEGRDGGPQRLGGRAAVRRSAGRAAGRRRRARSSAPPGSPTSSTSRAARRPGSRPGCRSCGARRSISLERQVRIAAGSLVVLGTAAGRLRPPGLPRPVRVRRGGAGVRGRHGHLRHGDAAGPHAVEPGRAGGGDVPALIGPMLLSPPRRAWRGMRPSSACLRRGRRLLAGPDRRRRLDLRRAAAGLRPGGAAPRGGRRLAGRRRGDGPGRRAPAARPGRGRGPDGPALRRRRDARCAGRLWLGRGSPRALLLPCSPR